ncbi:MAG: hypothetical protein FWF58_00720 [Firmicutes bacterium]|nr:hypothetical protein [Bacillota bacterium]
MFILGIITSMPISSVFSSKGKVNWGDGIIASIHMLIFMVLLVFRINEKEYSPIATFGMFTLLGIVFITCGIVEDLKCRKI